MHVERVCLETWLQERDDTIVVGHVRFGYIVNP